MVFLARSLLLSLFLIVAIGLVLTKTYWLWTAGPWNLPNPRKAKTPIAVEDSKAVTNARPIIRTETIISKNIFDPERGAGLTREAEANSQAFQRIRSMVLLGTAILGNNRFAILRMEEFPPECRESPAKRLYLCVSNSGIRWRGSGYPKFQKKELFLPGAPQR
jgi:hypothetical protein